MLSVIKNIYNKRKPRHILCVFRECFIVYWAKLFGFCSVAIFVTCSKYFVWHILFYDAIFTSVFRELTWFIFSISSVVT
jgi:hypothetical protein